MDKKKLLELEKNAHLSIAELRKKQPSLAKPIDERLEECVRRTVVARIAGGSEKLRKVAETIKLPLGATPKKTRLREATLNALRKAAAEDPELAVDEELKKELDEIEKVGNGRAAPGAKPDVTLADSVRFDGPVAFNPEFRRDLDAARLYRLSDATGLGDNTAKILIDHVGSVTGITNDKLAGLIKENKLSRNDAKAVGLASSLFHVLDERPELVAAANAGIAEIHELVKHDKAAWVRIIKKSKTKPPGGISEDEYAELLISKMTRLFPTHALAHHFAQVKVSDVLEEHAGLAELRTLNPNTPVVGIRNFDLLKTDGIAPAEIKKLKKQYANTVRLVNRYPGMRLATVLDDGTISNAEKAREVNRRTVLARRFLEDNAEVLCADLTHGSDEVKTLKFPAGVSETDKAMVLANTRTYQRAIAITEDPTDAASLVTGGFRSALTIAMSRPEVLIAKTGLKAAAVSNYQNRAKEVASAVTAHAGTVIDIFKGGFNNTAVGNISPALACYLKEIPGFADFFGSQDYCNCKHCQSIISPAAYFVDLMCFVDDYVTQPFFAAKPAHPLNLKTRRPDLWTLELTCENTNTTIPYLVIVNEILENAVAQDAGFAGDFADRQAVHTKVYKDTLPDKVDSFQQPLNLPFEELRNYLRHFEHTLADVAEAGNATGETLARLRLALPPKDYQLITRVNRSLPFLRRVYGIPFTEAGGKIKKFDAQKLLKPMGVTRDELGELIVSRFVTADGAVTIRIQGEKRSEESVQNDIENIKGLTCAALDRMHRFVRLCRATDWRIGELDLVLTHLKQGGIGSGTEAAVVQAVASNHRLQSRYGVSIEELIALWSVIPQHAILRSVPGTGTAHGDGPTVYTKPTSPLARLTIPLFTRLFNQTRFTEAGGDYPQPATTFLHPALASTAPVTVDPNLHRLQAGTGTDVDELLQLIVGLAKPLGIDVTSNDDNKKKFALSMRNLSLLYRHARLAKLLKVSIPALFALCGLAPEVKMAYIDGLPELEALLALHAWWKTTKWTVYELLNIIRPGLPPIITSTAPVTGTAGGEWVTYAPTIHGTAHPVETVTFGANADLASVIADWNAQASHTVAFRSDPFGIEAETGTHLSIRTESGTGPDSSIEITADSAPIFSAALPHKSIGCDLAAQLPTQETTSPNDLAKELAEHVLQSKALVFAETVFALLPPKAPIATSSTPLAGTAGGETVTYTPVLNGRTEAAETITFAAHGTIDAVVADWNAQASLTRAFRSDATGRADTAGTHLSITTKDTSGSNTRLIITADSGTIFTGAVPTEFKGTEITEEQSRALIAANAAMLEVVDAEGHYRLQSGVNPATPLTLPLLSPPAVTSREAVTGSSAGDKIVLQASINGAAPVKETLTLSANADIDAVIVEWNSASTLTTAFRSDDAGVSSSAGTYLSIRVNGVGGRNTVLTILEDSGELFDDTTYYGQGIWIDPGIEPALRELLFQYHTRCILLALLPGRIGVAPDFASQFLLMLGADLNADAYFRELRGDATSPDKIAGLIRPLQRLGTLFAQEAVFDCDNLEFIRTHAALFEINNFQRIGTISVKCVELFRKLLAPWLTRTEATPDLQSVLLAFTPATRFGGADQKHLAALLGCEIGLVQSLQGHLSLSGTTFAALQELITAVALAQALGMGGSVLKLTQSSNYDDLATASVALQSAFRAKYDDEAEWEKNVEPFRDALLSRKRDGLVAYLVHSGLPQFDEVTDLYHYYLLDVEVEGCMRTSRVAAAIDSVQLYVHRCLMNFEETPPGDADPVHVLPQSIPDDEWAWRKHYRIWEANRKIFLYPENYIEPELRDDKTPLFKTLEEELLSKEITDEAILEAYSRYLRGFDVLAHLTIAGSYHEKDKKSRRDVLHLFGVTAGDPPEVYYRRVEGAHYGPISDDRTTHWGAWEKLNIQVPVRKVSPVVHNGQLYLFWNRYTTKPVNKVTTGTSKFIGYQHHAHVEFSTRKVDGSWTPPQLIRLDADPFNAAVFPKWYEKDGKINDLIVLKSTKIVSFVVTGSIYGIFYVAFVADASGHGTIDFLGLKLEIQIPADLLSTGGTFTMEGQTFTATPVSVPDLIAPRYDSKVHPEPHDGYTLEGFGWDRVYPCSGHMLSLRGFDFQMWSPVDLYKLKIGARYEYDNLGVTGVPWINPQYIDAVAAIVWLLSCGRANLDECFPKYSFIWSRSTGIRRMLYKSSPGRPCFDEYSFASLLLDETRFRKYKLPIEAYSEPQWSTDVTGYLESLLAETKIADIPGDVALDVVNGSTRDVILQTSRDAFYLQGGIRTDGKYHLRRFNTSVSEDIASILFNKGLDDLLSTKTQEGLAEHDTGLDFVTAEVHDATNVDSIDFNGAMGTYLREIFFHIPFLIADHLNSQGRFEDAQRWYHYIFDPTASETIQNLPAGLSPEERSRRELDRNWRYREFRGVTLESLRAQLTNEAAIEQYKRDPFNPHAIARLRISAYQKAIVMKYADNLLDWGDDLFIKAFAQLNPEYLREAVLKYVTAQEILGDRPAQLGDCGEGKLKPKVFPKIKEAIDEDSEFLMEMESIIATKHRLQSPVRFADKLVAVDAERGAWAVKSAYKRLESPIPTAATAAPIDPTKPTPSLLRELAHARATIKKAGGHITAADAALVKKDNAAKPVTAATIDNHFLNRKAYWVPSWGWSFAREVNPIFCVPGNDRMLKHWNRVEDRLHKLRYCQDIDGVFRLLPLFAPEIDPGLLVSGKAAGLSLEDILAASSGNLPPYRFRYLIEKAKSLASLVQSFGAALLSALEKRDTEELARLRSIHQKNLLALTTEVKRNELKIAEESVEIVTRRQMTAEYRKEYYAGLIEAGLSGWEHAQYASRVTASVFKGLETTLQTAASISFLLPQLGSPFAMKYGGQEIGDSTASWAKVIGVAAGLAEITGTIGAIQSGFDRREQGWSHQKKLAEKDLKIIEKELAVAELRKAIATRSLELHNKAKEQHDEIMEFFADKFSNLGLYTHLSRGLQQLHREAYNNALAMARLAEQAYRFERPGDTSVFVGGEWDASRSGLLAGERLFMALQRMDKRFIETNTRQAEINQSFSLAQIAPEAIISLKETGHCEFAIPEFCFDVFYPGQYRRRVRAVRLTIPCITGPYTNISAKLTLLRSYIRKEAKSGAAQLFEVPVTGTSSVWTSTGQGDAGVFELNFRDEKYMPFEGAGAVSEWRLELPSYFHPFDYQTINDVLLNISYTAEENSDMRQQVESRNAAIEGALLHYLSNNRLTRVFSLRQEFSSAFNRLIEANAGTPVTIDITDRHFPLFLQSHALTVDMATLVIAIGQRNPVGSFAMSVNGTGINGFSNPTDPPAPGDIFGGLPAKSLGGAFTTGIKKQHTIMINDAGNLGAGPGAGSFLSSENIRDVLLVVEYRL